MATNKTERILSSYLSCNLQSFDQNILVDHQRTRVQLTRGPISTTPGPLGRTCAETPRQLYPGLPAWTRSWCTDDSHPFPSRAHVSWGWSMHRGRWSPDASPPLATTSLQKGKQKHCHARREPLEAEKLVGEGARGASGGAP